MRDVERLGQVFHRFWQVRLQYLNLHLTHRGALWASGAAQAGQFVRIILVWRYACKFLRGVGCFLGLASMLQAAS